MISFVIVSGVRSLRSTHTSQMSASLCAVVMNEKFQSYNQGDHLSGKPGNVMEFETRQGNVTEKILSWKSVPKLFIIR